MVSLLFLSRGLRAKEDNEKKRKREKSNEIQLIYLVRPYLVVFNQPKKCFQKGRRNINWWARQDSNLGPIHYECTALTN
tara:strand:+ start:1417 stop:1653 length:237 start_codon:yes stop_codon:yes gene_type:complete